MPRGVDVSVDPVLSDEAVLTLVRKHVPQAKAVRSVDETGHRARTYLVDDELLLKTQRQSQVRPETSLQKEVFFLNQIHMKDNQIRVPFVLGYGRGHDTEYTVMTRMTGKAARWYSLQDEQRDRLLYELGRTLRRIHQLDQEPFMQSQFFQEVIESDVRGVMEEAFEAVVERIGSRPAGWILNISTEQVAKMALDSLPSNMERVALHANPGPQHAFIDSDTREFTGLIDFGDAYISHPALDFRPWGSTADLMKLFNGYTSDSPVKDEFLAVLRSATVLQRMRMIPRHGAAAVDGDLRYWLTQM